MSRPTVYLPGTDCGRVAEYGADPDETREMIERYTGGQCSMLAERIYQITGWPMMTLHDACPAVHWLNRRDDGALVDAHDAVPWVLRSIISHRHEVANGDWRRWTRRFAMDETDIAEVDEFLDGPWMMAVIPPEDRLAIPLPRFDGDDTDDDSEESPSHER